MTNKKLVVTIHETLLAVVVALILIPASSAAVRGKEYKFRGAQRDGAFPFGGLVSDGAGNFYGTTAQGGANSCRSYPTCGTAFRLSREQSGHWMEAVIYSFGNGAQDGSEPEGALTIDTGGNLYGTTFLGGSSGWGTVFELSAHQDGTWAESILYSFHNSADGGGPQSGVVFDSAGNLYGTTASGGICNNGYCGGTVFKLTPSQNGLWTESTAFSFPVASFGQTIPSALVLDVEGNLYGTTLQGGSAGLGTVFQLTPNQDGSLTENVLHDFTDGLDGGTPNGGLMFDSTGNLYGEATRGGSFACPVDGCGLIFRVTPGSNGTWSYSVVYTFHGVNGLKGQAPFGGLWSDSAGNLYGTTAEGGDLSCFGFTSGCGTIFKLSPSLGGGATFSEIAVFDGAHGAYPEMGVMVGSDGNLYGTTSQGGDLSCNPPYGCGVVFTITP